MNEKEFCFFICTNNNTLLDECIAYINRLYVPEGYSIDLITISEAESITSAYNMGMKESDAKYKIYMHQDVFIINRNFLSDLLLIFSQDASIGLVGMVGYDKVPTDGVMWHENKCGTDKLYGRGFYSNAAVSDYKYNPEHGVSDVQLIDGLLMATSVDIEWDEEFDAWDFYDASQCMRFRERGYKIVVPNQLIPWFIHDNGYYLKLWDYEKYRQLFLKKYIK